MNSSIRRRHNLRERVYRRDNYTCVYCGWKPLPGVTPTSHSHMEIGLTLDHRTPKAQGGRFNYKNLVTCCRACNEKKANSHVVLPEECRSR